MARFEVTLSDGEKILVDHPAQSMSEILAAVEGKAFLLFSEVKGGSSTPARHVIISSSQVTLIRPLDERSTQGTQFVPKR
jgi:hypothetical protein